ncbi:MAG TPA: radical SAM family heme chaperone HemW [Bacteroidia bacterium]|nr:radical SAM family heme chaperone HemW [Bacteroidia bacterium]
MAGIYLHIPFCHKACSYCDFHFSTNLKKVDEMALAIVREAHLRKGYFTGRPTVETIYFGGGTPSLMPAAHLGKILDALRETFPVSQNPEITLEGNPDDLDNAKLKELQTMGVNRLSIGVQSFSDRDLLLLNRNHTAQQADRCIKAAQDLGIENITLDLIYGIPGSGMQQWQANVEQAVALQVPHVSAYALTVEEKTLLHHQIEKGMVTAEPDATHEAQYFHLIDRLADAGIAQYELSNFAKPGHRSRHNGAYWKGIPYLGLGPSAHSFEGGVRSSNVANNSAYLRALDEGRLAIASQETLSERDQLNEYLMTQLRIVEGLDLRLLKEKWGFDLFYREEEAVAEWVDENLIRLEDNHLRLTRHGFMVSDAIIRELFVV